MSKLLLLDTASMYYRAFHSLPESIQAADGTPINAVRGTLDRISRLIQSQKPNLIVAAWDTEWRPQWRVDLIPSYKTHRIEESQDPGDEPSSLMPDSLADQIPILEEVLLALGIPVIGHEDYEADDVVGTYSAQHTGITQIVTGDRDLFQLIEDSRNVSVLYTSKGELQQFKEENIINKYGIRANQYAEYAILRGDPSDGLPGVKGIGEKTASTLIRDFESIDNLYISAKSHDHRIKDKIRANLLEAEDYVQRALKVVPVACNIDIPHISELDRTSAPVDVLKTLASDLNLISTMSKLMHLLKIN